MPTERVGVLVIRAWTEQGVEGLRVRVTSRVDLEADEESVQTAGTVDDTCAIVRRWLESFTDP